MKTLDQAGLQVQQVLKRHKEFADICIIGNFEELARVDHE